MSAPLDRLTAALADRYRIERELGEGGMATVYLAADLKHDRQVAIKVLRPELAAVIGADRFLSEIKTTANLQHPHILPLFDSGAADGFLFYVMPYVQGETVRDRISREKQLPIADAVRIASEIAAALDYAHRHGVIHRDIKPENILLHDGSALVADFGIALAVSTAGTRMTETGMSLGTPHYMSPEQAMGEREITARSDVYALGCVLYEMLLGEPPFTGPTAQSIVAKVMTEKPAGLVARRERIPPEVEETVLTALEKLPADRFGSAAEFAAALGGGQTSSMASRSTRAQPARFAAPLPRLLLLALVAMAAVTSWALLRKPTAMLPTTRLSLDLPDLRVNVLQYYGAGFTLSPDGSRLVYVAQPPVSPSRLMVREMGTLAPRVLPGTEGADGPFFSPDGQWVGYTVNGSVYKVPVAGGPPVLLAGGGVGGDVLANGTWLEGDRILFANKEQAILSVPAGGGAVTELVAPPRGYQLAFPSRLPRPDAILVTLCSSNCADMTLLAVDLQSLKMDTVLASTSRGWYLPTGELVAVQQDGSVRVGKFDLKSLRFTTPPAVVLTGVQRELGITPEFTVADNGTMIYLADNQVGSDATIARVDRSGHPTTIDPEWVEQFTSMALSPDGRRLAVSSLEGAINALWVKQLDAGPLTRLSFDGTLNYRPAWRADGRSLTYTSDRTPPTSFLYQIRADGSGKPARVQPNDTTQVDEAVWSRDGEWLVFRTGVSAGVRDIYAQRTSGDTTRVTVAAGGFDEYAPALSPDSKWIAYVSVESGREEVYVRPFPDTDRGRWQVSTAGGAGPAWSHSGGELFYTTPADSLVSATVTGNPDFQVTGRRALFSTQPFVVLPFHRSYDVSPDDQSFIFFQRSTASGAEANRLTVVLNWFTELRSTKRSAP